MSYTKNKGVDCAHWDGDPLDMHKAKAAGISFWFEKATDGMSTDSTFKDRQPRIRATFDVRGWYHFCHCDGIGAAAQGKHFAAVTGKLQEHEYVAFDIEVGWGSLTGDKAANYALALIKAYQAATGATDDQIIIYGSLGWLRGQFGDALKKLTPYHLWAARYAPTLGDTSPWSAALIWQNSESGTVPGVGKNSVDTDWWIDGHFPIK